ncbi:MAG: transferase [Bacteroidota bacterium]
MYLIIPGRHHLLTQFQFKYLYALSQSKLSEVKDVNGNKITDNQPIEGIIFAVTSANHCGTKRNPIPFYLRAMIIQEFSKDLDVPVYVFGIDDVGYLENFASYTLKQIAHQSEYTLQLNPENTYVVCSSPVMNMYEKLGFKILPAELEDRTKQIFKANHPWQLLEQIASKERWEYDLEIIESLHPSSYKLWKTYNLGGMVKSILNDAIIGDDGDLTESRDYNTYVRQMDEIAELKYQETAPHINPGLIGDIGGAVGSWIKCASEEAKLSESDFYGIEVARQLFNICKQRKENGEFNNPNVFFAQKNAVTNLVFRPNTMNTIHTSSLTHEMESDGSREDLLRFIENRYEELRPGGVWINRDVVGPEDGDKKILMSLLSNDGENDWEQQTENYIQQTEYLSGLSSQARFLRFATDFRSEEDDRISYKMEEINEKSYVKISLRDAAEFLLTKDYIDNWESEMHERFCNWSINDWKEVLESKGFKVDLNSRSYLNPWIEENRLKGKAELFTVKDGDLVPHEFPPSNMLVIARKY